MNLQHYQHDLPFEFENGEIIENLTIAYHTAGKINPEKITSFGFAMH